ncbi:hypothetical protein [Microscilla marina]|uniref:Uncharacterized protein n=1 Tax=Microscilla marina ATCC 23134 TaxID=313606 RepID=A1ZRT2_MICM2|nr:hypothetical protein [Microscilla marina]EAY26987.1 conserved hypothetical protein [Microscilla marina ATCC 23134]
MQTFTSIKELLKALHREASLLGEMFAHRKNNAFKYDDALVLVDDQPARIESLISHAVLNQNGSYLEINNQFLDFFEQILAVNEEVNLAFIHSNIQKIEENIEYFGNEKRESAKYGYLKVIKGTLKTIGMTTLRNVMDLRRNIETTFKHEPNYKNKKAKLEHLDKKREDIENLINQTTSLVNDKHELFFHKALDVELDQIIVDLKKSLGHCQHSLLEIEKQIIDFLNQIKHQNQVIEKLRKVKYLKDQFTLDTHSNLRAVLSEERLVAFEKKPQYALKASLNTLSTSDEAFELICKVAKKAQTKAKPKLQRAERIEAKYLNSQAKEEVFIDLDGIKNGFLAGSNDLFGFLMKYDFPEKLTFDRLVTIYCQLISQYEHEFNITHQFGNSQNISYALVYPK